MADKKFGIKRVCSNCEIKFYDLNKKSPLICPHCKSQIVLNDELFYENDNKSINQQRKLENNKNEFENLVQGTDDDNEESDEVISLDDAAIEEEGDIKN